MAEKKQFKHRCELRLLLCEPNPFRPDRVTVGFVLRDTNPENPRVEVCLAPKLSAIQCIYPEADVEAIEGTLLEMKPILKNIIDFEQYLQSLPADGPAEFSLLPGTALLTNSIEDELPLLTKQYLARPKRLSSDASDEDAEGEGLGKPPSEIGRAYILRQMQAAFSAYGVWNILQRDIPVSDYTFKHDQQKIDFAYRSKATNAYRMFQAVSIVHNLDKAKLLAYSWPDIRQRVTRDSNPELYGIVENPKYWESEQSQAALAFMESKGVIVRPVSSMPGLAATAAAELKL